MTVGSDIGDEVDTEPTLRRDARANLEKLLAAAVVAVHRDGTQIPMAAIAAEAGVGVATLYRRFATREALLDALTERSFELVLSNARQAESHDGSGLSCLGVFLDTAIRQRNELLLPLHGGPGLNTALSRRLQSEVHGVLQGIIERGRADGSVRADATPFDVVMFGALLAQPMPVRTRWDATCRRLKDIYLDGLMNDDRR